MNRITNNIVGYVLVEPLINSTELFIGPITCIILIMLNIELPSTLSTNPCILAYINSKDKRIYLQCTSNALKGIQEIQSKLIHKHKELSLEFIEDHNNNLITVQLVEYCSSNTTTSTLEDRMLRSIRLRDLTNHYTKLGYSSYRKYNLPKYFLKIVPVTYYNKHIRFHVTVSTWNQRVSNSKATVLGIFKHRYDAVNWCKEFYGPNSLNGTPIDKLIYAINIDTRLYMTNPLTHDKYLRSEYQSLIKRKSVYYDPDLNNFK